MRGITASKVARGAWLAICVAGFFVLQHYSGSDLFGSGPDIGRALGELLVVFVMRRLMDGQLKKLTVR
jgi:hypothetical protein